MDLFKYTNSQGVTYYQKYKYQDGGWSVEERCGKFVLIDAGEYGTHENEIGTFDTLDEACQIGENIK